MSAPRVLLVRFSAIGDCVMASWTASAIRNAYPDCHLVWAIQERCAPVVDTARLVSRLVLADMDAWRGKRWSPSTWSSQLATFSSLRRERFDVGFDLQGHSKTALCLRLSGAKKRLASRATDLLARRLNTVVKTTPKSPHEVDVAVSLIQTELSVTLPELPIMPGGEVSIQPRLVSLQTGAGGKGKAYPIDSFRRVAESLRDAGWTVVGLGGPRDEKLGIEGATDYAGTKSLAESMEVVRTSALHVASDTGTGHIAAAYGVPVVSIFGPMAAERFRPWTSRGIVLSNGIDPGAVHPQDVVEACNSLLSGAACGS